MRHMAIVTCFALLATACGSRYEAQRSDVPHAGLRTDAPPAAQRGNAEFSNAAYDPSGHWLLTQGSLGRLIVWDASTGDLRGQFKAQLPDQRWFFSATGDRLLVTIIREPGFTWLELPSGTRVSQVADGGNRDTRLAGISPVADQALLFKHEALELWALEPAQLLKRVDAPWSPERLGPRCVGGMAATYNDKKCWEWSPDGRWLALAFSDPGSTRNPSKYFLIDAHTLEFRPIEDEALEEDHLAAFAFSGDSRTLAIGLGEGMRFYDVESGQLTPLLPGAHRRNQYLGAMQFTGSETLIALADQLEVNLIDSERRRILYRHRPPEDDWEGVFCMSRDGSRVVLYHFLSDTLEVLDGRTGKRTGWICPYFCNAPHNPVQVRYAVSPDGSSVAVSHFSGTAVWDTDRDALRFPLMDPELPLMEDP